MFKKHGASIQFNLFNLHRVNKAVCYQLDLDPMQGSNGDEYFL